MVTTLVAVAHGTRHPGGARTVEALVARVRHRLPGVPVRTAYAGIQRPSLPEALAGVSGPAVVVPLLLAPAVPATSRAGRPPVNCRRRRSARTGCSRR